MSRTEHGKPEPLAQLLQDFVWSDRRLAERDDIEINVKWRKPTTSDATFYLERKPYERMKDNLPDGRILIEVAGGGSIELTCSRELPGREGLQLLILANLLLAIRAKTDNWPHGYPVGLTLSAIREHLAVSRIALARQLRIKLNRLADWEGQVGAPGPQVLYSWCQALGLVCPPKTALVRVVDFSPELLRFLQQDPTRLRSLTPDQFERFTAERLDRMGYNVTLTGATNRKDGGIDLIAVPKSASLGSVVIAGQVKHHRCDQKTGRDAVDRLLAWKDSYFGIGLLVTNTNFTNDAVWTAQRERNARFLRLRDFIDLKRWLEGQFGTDEDWREIPDRVELAPGVVIEIPRPRITSVFGTTSRTETER
jgi:transcriptional regulator with XRE-family HTH domain